MGAEIPRARSQLCKAQREKKCRPVQRLGGWKEFGAAAGPQQKRNSSKAKRILNFKIGFLCSVLQGKDTQETSDLI